MKAKAKESTDRVENILWRPSREDPESAWLPDLEFEERPEGLGIPKRYASAHPSDFLRGEVEWWSKRDELWKPMPASAVLRLVKAGPRDVLVQGVNGAGKSHFAAALAIQWGAMWIRVSAYLDEVRKEFGRRSAGPSSSKVAARSLVLDDITAANSTDFGVAAILELISSRYDDMQPTIVTTDTSLSAIAANLDTALASRLSAFHGLRVSFLGNPSGDRRRGEAR